MSSIGGAGVVKSSNGSVLGGSGISSSSPSSSHFFLLLLSLPFLCFSSSWRRRLGKGKIPEVARV
jgi:hypothetical protein